MPVEYDLVVLGGGAGGLAAAREAAQLRARVALVELPTTSSNRLNASGIVTQALIQAGRVAHTLRNAADFGVYADGLSLKFAETTRWLRGVLETAVEADAPEALAALGVDVIRGDGQFINRRTFEVQGRQLRARAFLLATGSCAAPPPITGLERVGYLTPEQIANLSERPESLAVIGGDPMGCELSQALARLGCRVTLLTSGPHLLEQEDPEAARLVQACFEAEGIRVLSQTQLSRVEQIEGKKRLYAGEQVIDVNEILLTTGRAPNVATLGLEATGVRVGVQGVRVNDKLQTRNPRIYACGELIGGYPFPQIAVYEAQIALRNALFLPTRKVDYRALPWAIFTAPELARVGLTEPAARRQYGKDVWVLKQELKSVACAQVRGATVGFCKILVRSSGEILGAHLVGESASELLAPIVLAMASGLSVEALGRTLPIQPTLSEVHHRAAQQFRQQRYARNSWLQLLLEGFFSLRRAWG